MGGVQSSAVSRALQMRTVAPGTAMAFDDGRGLLQALTRFMGTQGRGKGCSACSHVPGTGGRWSGGLLRSSHNYAASARIRCLHEDTKIEHAPQLCLACTTSNCIPLIYSGPQFAIKELCYFASAGTSGSTSVEMGTFWMSSRVTLSRPGSLVGTLIWQCGGCPSRPMPPSTGRGT